MKKLELLKQERDDYEQQLTAARDKLQEGKITSHLQTRSVIDILS